MCIINHGVLCNFHKSWVEQAQHAFLTPKCDFYVFAGVTNLEKIQSNVKRAIAGKFPLYCLGFGFDVNFEFLESMSLQNNGEARRIYEDADADLQLKVFQTY